MKKFHDYSNEDTEHNTESACAVARRILAYMVEHPEADDSLEGILQWWLLEQEVRVQHARVKRAIKMLIDEGLVVEHRSAGSKMRYKANWEMKSKITELVDERKEEDSR
jgi:Fe2+ or Zn2+ uptake regulation protein